MSGFTSPTLRAASNFADLAQRVQASVVRVVSSDYDGTGFFVAPSCSVVSARHVVEVYDSTNLDDRIDIHVHSGQVIRYEVDYEVEAKDFVVLRPTRPIECQELSFTPDPPRPGQAVLLAGYPDLHADSGFSAMPAHIINTDATPWATDYLVFGFATHGGSGPPIVDLDGLVVGMNIGRWAVDLDAEENWIYLDYVIAVVDVAKHLR